MGHDVYITRAPHYLDGAQAPISKQDWRALVAGDPELRTPDPGVPDYAEWTGPTSVRTPWIDLEDGNLFARNPDHSFIRKLIDIAGRLSARVQGEGGELYSVEGGLVVLEAPLDDASAPPAEPEDPAPAPELERLFREARLQDLLGDGIAHPDGDASVSDEQDDPHASFVRAPDEMLVEPGGRAPGVEVPFDVGQRVRTPWGRLATVVEIDRGAELGMGHIEIKYEDGTTATMSCVAHGLEPA